MASKLIQPKIAKQMYPKPMIISSVGGFSVTQAAIPHAYHPHKFSKDPSPNPTTYTSNYRNSPLCSRFHPKNDLSAFRPM